MKAKDHQRIWDKIPKKVKLEQIELSLTDISSYYQTINEFVIFKTDMVINKNHKSLRFFDSKEEAINYCLDNLKESKKIEQSSLF